MKASCQKIFGGGTFLDATKTVMSFTPFYTIMGQVWGNNSRFYCPRDKQFLAPKKYTVPDKKTRHISLPPSPIFLQYNYDDNSR